MTLIKTSLLNGIAVFVRMLSLLGINKLLAIYVGPSGYALVGQFQNAIQMLTTFANGTVNLGVVRYTSEYIGDEYEVQRRTLWRTAGTFSLISSLLIGFLIVIFRESLSSYFLATDEYSFVFIVLAIGLVFFVFNTFFLAVLNGKKELRSYVVANVVGSLLSLILTFFFSRSYGLSGTLIALASYQSVAFFSTLLICLRLNWFKLSNFLGEIDLNILKNLFKYALMALSSSIFIPLSQVLIRDYYSSALGQESAGYWEAINRLGAAFILFITSTLTVYYLPKIAELREREALWLEVKNCFKLITPCVVLCSACVYIFRAEIIILLFTDNFLIIEKLFFWQFTGEVIKVAGWLLGFILVGRGLLRLYVFSELIFSLSLYLLNLYLVPLYGLEGGAISHAVNSFLHFIFLLVSLKRIKVI